MMWNGGGWDVIGSGWLLPFIPLVLLLVAWGLFWKGLALWHSAKHDKPWWFIALLIINTAGILEIIFLFLILKLKVSELFGPKENSHPAR